MSLTRQAHQIIRDHAEKYPIQLAIDATCGNGHDTLFLSQISQWVFGFDVQEEAIANTTALLEKNNAQSNVELFHTGHENIQTVLSDTKTTESIDVAIFNLGYLPKGNNPEITTHAESSTQAISKSLSHLKPNGIISLLCYRGHDGGAEEFMRIKQLLNDLDSKKWKIAIYESSKATDITPILLIITKA